mgnify:FL=1
MTLLELENVSHAYGTQLVVDNLSLRLAEGEIACLLGASGCGKTTVLRLIAGFETPKTGTIRLRGETVAQPGRSLAPERRRVGMVFQDYALFPHLTVAGNIGFGLKDTSASARRQIDELLALVGLSGSGNKFPHELSGGQQQRVALARALAPRPHLLLLDEPFSNLDVALRERLSLEVRAILKQAGMAAILVTHDQHEAFAVAERVGVMRAGCIEQWDTPYNLYHRPTTCHVADFVGQGVLLPGKATRSHGIDTEFGTLAGVQVSVGGDGAPLSPGAPVQVLLRPDDVLHDDAAPLRAAILSRHFRGAEFLYTLGLPSGAQVLARVPSHHDHAVGERIGIRLATDRIVAFAANTTIG